MGMGMILLSDKIIGLIYGDKFQNSVLVLQLLAVFLFTIVGYCNGPLLQVIGKQRFFMWTEALAVLINAALCFLLIPTWKSVGPAVAFVTAGLITFFVHSIVSHRYFGMSLPWLTIGKVSLATIFMALVVFLFLLWGRLWFITLIFAPIVYSLAILALGVLKRSEFLVVAGAPIPNSDLDIGNPESIANEPVNEY
jgi:O-antigen/teichoic acid export membrane protein